MKKLILLLVLSLPGFLRADEAIKNPDFTDGAAHWEGDGRSAALVDDDNSNPLAAIAPQAGLVVKLDRENWTKVTQDFRPLMPTGVLTVTFRYSSDLVFSTDKKDYKDIPVKIGYGVFQPFRLPVGTWMVGWLETAVSEMTYFIVKSDPGADVQTYTAKVEGLVVRVDKTICLAFPPGQGTVTLLHVGLTDQ